MLRFFERNFKRRAELFRKAQNTRFIAAETEPLKYTPLVNSARDHAKNLRRYFTIHRIAARIERTDLKNRAIRFVKNSAPKIAKNNAPKADFAFGALKATLPYFLSSAARAETHSRRAQLNFTHYTFFIAKSPYSASAYFSALPYSRI